MNQTLRPRHRSTTTRAVRMVARSSRAHPVVAVVAVVCLAVTAWFTVADQLAASAQVREADARVAAADAAGARSARDVLAGLVDTADALVAATDTITTADGERRAVSAALATSRPMLAGTPTRDDVGRLTSAAEGLRAAIDALQRAQVAWQSARDADAAATARASAAAEASAAAAAAEASAAAEATAAARAASAQRAATAAATSKDAATTAPTYDGSNGRVDPSLLCDIPFLSDHQVLCRALPDLVAFSDAYRAQFGIPLPIDPWPESCYRSYDQQVATFARYGSPRAAIPGTSNHGWGKAIDIDDAVGADGNPLYGFGTPGYEWMVANGPRFGWEAPSWALQNGGNPEPWHFEYVR